MRNNSKTPHRFFGKPSRPHQAAKAASDGPALRNRHPWRPSLGLATGLLAGFLAATAHAGDLLRGGAAYGQKNGAAAPQPGAAAAAAAKANAADILARTTQAVNSVQALQKAANSLSQGANNAGLNPAGGGMLPNVPDGLATGGLQVAPGATPGSSLWQGANLPVQSQSGGTTTVSITQQAPQAILTWQTFNIGRHTLLQFDQDLGGSATSEWIAFNIVNDPSGVPSQILGSIQANGQVYVVNRNGIIFGGASQVNTHTLVASSLPINQSLVSQGLLNLTVGNPAFLFSSATDTGPVIVEEGADLSAPASAANVGGRVALVGSNVENDGTISTPDGQTILAAGLQVGMLAHSTADPSLRGLDVFVGNVDGGSGVATNNGVIEAQEASTIITGKQVNQNGIIDSGTSVTLNGRVDLVANYNSIPNPSFNPSSTSNPIAAQPFLPEAAGAVTLGPGSVTRILPDVDSTETVAGTQLALPSMVNIQGKTIYFGVNSTLLAPGASLPSGSTAIVPVSSVPLSGNLNYGLQAGVSINAGNWVVTGSGASIGTQFEYSNSQIYVDHGVTINVAGTTDVSVPVGQNILSLQLRGGELADSPVEQSSVLRGVTINIDIRNTGVYNGVAWIGTPLGDAWGFVNLIQRTVAQLTTAGGSVSLRAGESVVLQTGSTLNVSGGYINFQGGMVQTTRVISDGQIYDIADATPDRIYSGFYDGTYTTYHPAWGVADQYTNPLALTGAHYETSYVSGAAGGQLTIAAGSVALDGSLLGNTVSGPHQETNAPAGSAFGLDFQGAGSTPVVAPNIVFLAGGTLPPADSFAVDASGNPLPLHADRLGEVVLSPDLLSADGFATLVIYDVNGNITVPANVALKTAAGGSIEFTAANIDIEGQVNTPAGSQSYTTYNFVTSGTAEAPDLPPPTPGRGLFTLGPNASLSAAGLVVDDRPFSATAYQNPLVATSVSVVTFNPTSTTPVSPTTSTTSTVTTTNGGSISVQSLFLNLTPGSTVDVSGGVAFSGTGQRSFGSAGSINLHAAQDPGNANLLGGWINLGGTLKGFSGVAGGGGSLSITAPFIQIGGDIAPYGGLFLQPDFFNQGGFANFTLTGIGRIDGTGNLIPGVLIAPNTIIDPAVESYVAGAFNGPGGTAALQPVLEPEGLRSPVNLTFNALGFTDAAPILLGAPGLFIRGDFVLGQGAVIRVDPQAAGTGSVTINAATVNGNPNPNTDTATILGSIIAPGGTISISGASKTSSLLNGAPPVNPLATVYLGPQSVLSAAGATVVVPDNRGYLSGTVYSGGSITVAGNIVADAGAKLDVSGTSGVLDLPPADVGASTPLLGALSGSAVQSPTVGTNFAFRGLIVPSLPGTTTPSNEFDGSFSGTPVMPVRVDSNGGSITLSGGEFLISNATLSGAAGGPMAQGGSLTISSGRFNPAGTLSTPLLPTLLVTQGTVPQPSRPAGETVVGNGVADGNGNLIPGLGYFAADDFLNGGFDSLTLKGTVQFSGPVTINARNTLTVATSGILIADSNVNLSAPYVVLGQPFVAPFQGSESSQINPFTTSNGPVYPDPSFGSGTLNVTTTSLIDIGNLSLQNIGRANFVADNADIRGDGTLDVSGSVYLRAGQIYPASGVTFTIAVYDPNVQVVSSTQGSNAVTLASATLPPGFGVGSPLLGSTVQSINGVNVTLAGGANATISAGTLATGIFPTGVTFAPGAGSVTITGSGVRPLPLAATGVLNIYASNITQGGTLRAPLGSINLGWDGSGTSPQDPLTGAGVVDSNDNPVAANAAIPIAQQVTLTQGSVTSVSAIDPITGQGVLIPDGFNIAGAEWISSAGVNLVNGMVPGKSINIAGLSVTDEAGSSIDVRGGGDLFAYQFVPGNGGSTDILGTASSAWSAAADYVPGTLVTFNGATWTARVASIGQQPSTSQYWSQVPTRYAVIPGYQFDYAPYAPNNLLTDSANLAVGDPGYVSNLKAGSQIYLNASNGLPAGVYTLLPARYATLPGAVLITPESGTVAGNFVQADGSTVVGGYRFNSLNPSGTGQTLVTKFDVAPSSISQTFAQYTDYFANSFLATEINLGGSEVPRLPIDAGAVAISGDNSLVLDGQISGGAPPGGQHALIDLSTSAPIVITGPGGTGPAGSVVLNATLLDSYGAESLLIGGLRQTSTTGTNITVNAPSIEVNNAGSPLIGPEIILVATNTLTVDPGAQILQEGTLPFEGDFTSPSINIGNPNIPGSGDGVLLRVSDMAIPLVRSGVDMSAVPTLTVGAGAQIAGNALTLDSTATLTVDPAALLSGRNVTLDAGRISVVLPTNPGTLQASPGLVLEGTALTGLSGASSLNLTGYMSIDLYGTGTFSAGGLALHTPDLRGPNGGDFVIDAGTFSLDNVSASTGSGPVVPAQPPAGTLTVNSQTISIGQGEVNIDQYASVALSASGGVLFQNAGGLSVPGNLTITSPLLTASELANQTVTAAGVLDIEPGAGGAGTLTGGLGATLAMSGTTVTENSNILLPSGTLTLTATGPTSLADPTVGAVNVGGSINAGGTAQKFFDLFQYTDAGQINLASAQGSVTVNTGAVLNVAAQTGGGNAGTLSISAPNGQFTVADNTMFGQAGVGGTGGDFVLDVGSVPGGSVSSIDAALDIGGFNQSRDMRVRTGDVTVGDATSLNYTLSTDSGSITVTGTINASGPQGGTINLIANGSVTLDSGSVLNAAGTQGFNAAGKGGAISLEAGSETNGTLTLQALGSGPQVNIEGANGMIPAAQINLSVAGDVPASSVVGTANVAVNLPATDNGIDVITTTQAGTINFADGTTAAIIANTPTSVTNAVSVTLASNGTVSFAGSAALGELAGTLHIRAPQDNLNTDLQVQPINGTIIGASQIVIEGYKLYTPAGGTINAAVENQILANGNTFAGTSGTTTAAYTTMLDRLLPGSQLNAYAGITMIEPGAEIVNPTGNLTLTNNWDLESYRFGPNSAPGDLTLRADGNLVFNFKDSLSDGFAGATFSASPLAAGNQSWSYRLVAGADFSAADYQQVQSIAALGPNNGSLLLGQGSGILSTTPVNATTSRQTIVTQFYQTIRTGTGSINIVTGEDVQLLDPLATIYTAGTQAPAMADFATPITSYTSAASSPLGASQAPFYGAFYTMDGGNVTITAQDNIEHLNSDGSAYSSLEMPTSWLYRRGYVSPTTGKFAASSKGEIASTTWWVDFSNFFEGIGALGGGNVTLTAGNDVVNVDALVPTNARMSEGTPNSASLLELGGGNLVVRAGDDINGGVYYVERGTGTLSAGNTILTNATRLAGPDDTDVTNELPTTLFLGQGSFNVTARGNVLLGPVANPFLLPEGLNNGFQYRTYFSTYASTDSVNVSSLTGNVTIQDSSDLGEGSLSAWYNNVLLWNPNLDNASLSQPWLRLDETSLTPYETSYTVMPPTLNVTTFTGDIDLVGTINLAPSPTGSLNLLSAGSVNGLVINGISNGINQYGTASIDVSDTNPTNIPGITTPYSFLTQTNASNNAQILNLAAFFAESGSVIDNYASIQTKTDLHDSSLLHTGDPNPVRIYAGGGDVTGITLYAPKATDVLASQDITDVAFYIQNVSADDTSVVSAGRDIILYDASTPQRAAAQTAGNQLIPGFTPGVDAPASGAPDAGDVQINGPGTLEVLAGRNLDLGSGENNSDGTGVGITSNGNARNPFLPFGGASIIAMAGVGGPGDLSENQSLNFDTFITKYLSAGASGGSSYLSELGLDTSDLSGLTEEQKAQIALDVFYIILRDAGRAKTAGTGSYSTGFGAITSLFGSNPGMGDITTQSRVIVTESGGNISLAAPNGSLTLQTAISTPTLAPPGIVTQDGGNISILTNGDVDLGISRIFTLRGGNIVIWSSAGNIAAGSSPKTVVSAPPTRVLIDPVSGDVKTDLAGLATGGGIGVLATVAGVAPGNVDLIAPVGVVDAGDAGIRATGNLNIAATKVLNANNIQVSGTSSGTPVAAVVASPNIGGLTAGNATTAASAQAASDLTRSQGPSATPAPESDSTISVEVVGYGGGEGDTSGAPTSQ